MIKTLVWLPQSKQYRAYANGILYSILTGDDGL